MYLRSLTASPSERIHESNIVSGPSGIGGGRQSTGLHGCILKVLLRQEVRSVREEIPVLLLFGKFI